MLCCNFWVPHFTNTLDLNILCIRSCPLLKVTSVVKTLNPSAGPVLCMCTCESPVFKEKIHPVAFTSEVFHSVNLCSGKVKKVCPYIFLSLSLPTTYPSVAFTEFENTIQIVCNLILMVLFAIKAHIQASILATACFITSKDSPQWLSDFISAALKNQGHSCKHLCHNISVSTETGWWLSILQIFSIKQLTVYLLHSFLIWCFHVYEQSIFLGINLICSSCLCVCVQIGVDVHFCLIWQEGHSK